MLVKGSNTSFTVSLNANWESNKLLSRVWKTSTGVTSDKFPLSQASFKVSFALKTSQHVKHKELQQKEFKHWWDSIFLSADSRTKDIFTLQPLLFQLMAQV